MSKNEQSRLPRPDWAGGGRLTGGDEDGVATNKVRGRAWRVRRLSRDRLPGMGPHPPREYTARLRGHEGNSGALLEAARAAMNGA